MKPRWQIALALGLCLLGHPVSGPAAETDELKALRQRLERLKKEIAATEGGRAEASDQLRESEQAISEASRTLRDTEATRRSAVAELRSLEERARRHEGEAAKQGAQLSRLLYGRYLYGDRDFARLLLSGDDPQALARDTHYLGYVSRAHAATIRLAQAAAEQLAELADRMRAKTEEIAKLEAQQRTERANLERERSKWQRTLDQLSKEIGSQRRELATLKRDEQRLARLVEQLQRALRERAAISTPRPPERKPDRAVERNDKVPESGEGRGVFFSTLRGRLRLPVRGEVIGRFGAPRGDQGLAWKGVFIGATTGEEVRAVAGGRIVFADWMRGFGNLIIVDHGESFLTIYGNNESLLKQVGEAVRGGEVIATVGRTGGNETPGLYFELRHEGRVLDPLSWVTLR